MSGELSIKQERFILEYLKDFNGANAAIRAGYSPISARTTAARMLAYDNVQSRLKELRDKQAERLEINADMILGELVNIAKADLGDAYDKNGNILPISEMSVDLRRAIATIEETQNQYGSTKKIKRWDKLKALELLGKYLALWTDKKEVSGGLTLESLVAGANTDSDE